MPPTHSLPRQAVLIVNVHSRRGQELFDQAVDLLQKEGVDLLATHALHEPDELRPKVREAVQGGAPMVIVGGGDGSVSSVVDEFAGHACIFALLPLGTANSFARGLGLPLDLPGAVATIARGTTRRVDLGVINGDHFANFATLGFGPVVSATVPHVWKKRFGRLGYLAWAISRLFYFEPFQLRLRAGEEVHEFTTLEARVANGAFHGGIAMVHNAQVDSGQIVIQIVTGPAKSRLLWSWLASLLRLTHAENITHEFVGNHFQIETDPPMDISIDGEVVSQTPTVVEIAAGAIAVAVPRSS